MIETQTKANTSRAGILDGNGGLMGQFAKAQEATGKAHITIQVAHYCVIVMYYSDDFDIVMCFFTQGGASNAAVNQANLASLLSKRKKDAWVCIA